MYATDIIACLWRRALGQQAIDAVVTERVMQSKQDQSSAIVKKSA